MDQPKGKHGMPHQHCSGKCSQRSHDKNPIIIFFEGVNGIGKSTLLQKFANYFSNISKPCFLTEFPSKLTENGRYARTLIKSEVDFGKEALAECIKEDFESFFSFVGRICGETIILADRSPLSLAAYQDVDLLADAYSKIYSSMKKLNPIIILLDDNANIIAIRNEFRKDKYRHLKEIKKIQRKYHLIRDKYTDLNIFRVNSSTWYCDIISSVVNLFL